MMQTSTYLISTVVLLLAGTLAYGESMRCGAFVVNETTSVADLLTKCGEPATKDVKHEDVITRNKDTGLSRKIGTKVIERWVYQRSNRVLPMAVTIVDGKVTALERSD